MTNNQAIANIRELGEIFVASLFSITGKDPKDDSPLMNGLVAYEMLGLKGEFPHIDESVDIVMRIIYKGVIESMETTK